MADTIATATKRLPRSILASFLPDPRAIKTIEDLTTDVGAMLPDAINVINTTISNRVESVTFYSENEDITDELTAYLKALAPRLQDIYGGGGDTDSMPQLSVNFLGRQYKISDQILLDAGYPCLELSNFAFVATPSSNWASVESVIQIGNAAASGRTIRIGLRDYSIQCGKYASGVHFQQTTQCYSDRGNVSRMTGYGIKADVSNRRIEINGGCLQEFGTGDDTGKTWANRTAVGLWIEGSDGVARSVICPVNKYGIYFNNIRNFAVLQCHPWMGDLNDESERYDAFCVKLGTIDPADDDNGASGIQFEQCYFDHGPVAMQDSFGHQFVGCTWTGGGTGIYPMVLTATAADETALGLKITNGRISKQHNRDFFDFRTSGAGTWNVRKQYELDIGSAGTAQLLPSKLMNGFWVIDEGANAKPDPTMWDAPTRAQIADTPALIQIAARPGTYTSHTIYPGSGFLAARWGGGAGTPVAFYGALSRSSTVGVFGGYPQSGDVLARFGGCGDTGTDFSAVTSPGACIDVQASENWGPAANGTILNFKVTTNGATGSANSAWTMTPDLLPSAFDTANVGSNSFPVAKSFALRRVYPTQAAAPVGVTGALIKWFDGTDLWVKNAAGTVFLSELYRTDGTTLSAGRAMTRADSGQSFKVSASITLTLTDIFPPGGECHFLLATGVTLTITPGSSNAINSSTGSTARAQGAAQNVVTLRRHGALSYSLTGS